MEFLQSIKRTPELEPFKCQISRATVATLQTNLGKSPGTKELITPYGFYSMPPVGTKVYAIPVEGKDLLLGQQMTNTTVAAGEIYLKNAAGAYIHLKNDGTIVLNGLKITKNGTIG